MKPSLVRFLTTHSGPPIRVGFTPDAGRGVFATREIRVGELIHTAEPLVSHPSLQNLTKVCYFCLRWLPHLSGSRHLEGNSKKVRHHFLNGCTDNVNLQPIFCSQSCIDSSSKNFYAIEKKANWADFHHFCSEQNLRLPLLAKRLVCMVLSEMVQKDALDILSYHKPQSNVASCWMLTWEMLLEAFKSSQSVKEKLNSLSAEWYINVLARISLNSFRIEILAEESTNLLAAAVASVSGQAVSGSGVYVLPSMYNHECDPNVDISWPTNSMAQLTARRDIKEGEELRITYIDSSMPRCSRQQLLQNSYHFLCNCARCRDDD